MSTKSGSASTTPKGLGARGRAFWRTAVAEFELSGPEVELLAEVCRLLDDVDDLRESLARDGTVVAGSTGQPRINPALSELRQHRLALGKLLAQLALPDDVGDVLATPMQARGRRATTARWGARVTA